MNVTKFADIFYSLIKEAELHAPPAMVKSINEKLDQVVSRWSQLKNKVELKETFGVDVDLSGMPDKYNKIIEVVSPYFDMLRIDVIIYAIGKSQMPKQMINGAFTNIDFQMKIYIYLPEDFNLSKWANYRDKITNITIHHELGHMMQYFRYLYERKRETELKSDDKKVKLFQWMDSPSWMFATYPSLHSKTKRTDTKNNHQHLKRHNF